MFNKRLKRTSEPLHPIIGNQIDEQPKIRDHAAKFRANGGKIQVNWTLSLVYNQTATQRHLWAS
jgi:hypothetical protein